MKESIPCENCGRYYGHTSNCLSFIIKSSSGHRMDVLEKLQAENAKLRSVIMLASEASCYTEYEDACSIARQVLKELDNK